MNDEPVEIDLAAPALASRDVEIDAPPEIVWGVLTDLAAWPSWNPDVKSVTVDGPMAPGTTFRWRAGPGTITSTLQTVEPPSRLLWTGRTLGIRAVHAWELEPRNGGTVVRSAESWNGLVVRLLRRWLARTLRTSTEQGLRHLKAEAERQGRRAAPIRRGF